MYYWQAHLSDGRTIREDDPSLVDAALSPWRALERQARELDLQILAAAQVGPEGALELEAQGWPLECGQAYYLKADLFGGVQGDTRVFRFVCRLERTRRVWAVVEPATGKAWNLPRSPHDAMCPDPYAAG